MLSSNLHTECHPPRRLTASHLSHRSFCLGSPFKLAPIVTSTVNTRAYVLLRFWDPREIHYLLLTACAQLFALNMYHYAAGMTLPLLGCPNKADSPHVVQYCSIFSTSHASHGRIVVESLALVTDHRGLGRLRSPSAYAISAWRATARPKLVEISAHVMVIRPCRRTSPPRFHPRSN